MRAIVEVRAGGPAEGAGLGHSHQADHHNEQPGVIFLPGKKGQAGGAGGRKHEQARRQMSFLEAGEALQDGLEDEAAGGR